MKQSFLIIQTAFIGDVILATAVMEKLHRVYPDAAIDAVVRKGNEDVLAGHPFIRSLFVWNKKEKYRDLWRVIRLIRKQQYTAVINLQRFTASGVMTVAARSELKIGFDKNPMARFFTRTFPHVIGDAAHPEVHEIDRCLALVASFTDAHRDLPRIYPTKQDEQFIAKYLNQTFVTLSPASVWFTKQWPEHKWVELIRALPATYRIYLLGAPSDEAMCNRLVTESGRSKVLVLAGTLSLKASAALMSHATMNYTNDSAPLHLCSAMNAPVTSIFCSTIPGFGFGPLSSQSFVVQTDEPLSCRPCGLHGHRTCPQGHFRCTEIAIEKVLASIPLPA